MGLDLGIDSLVVLNSEFVSEIFEYHGDHTVT